MTVEVVFVTRITKLDTIWDSLDLDVMSCGVKQYTGADNSMEEIDLLEEPQHHLTQLIGASIKQEPIGDSSSLIKGISMISVGNSLVIHESPNTNGFIVFTTSKGKKKCIGRMSLTSISKISKLKLHIDSHFDKLQPPWTIQFQNLQRLKCIHVAALEKIKTFLIEQMPSLCFSRLLNELCHFEIRREIKASNFVNLHRSDTPYNLPGPNALYSNHAYSKRKQIFDDVNTDKFNGSTQNQADCALGVLKQLKNALFALIFQVFVSLHFAQKCHHVAILVIFLTDVACTDVCINCTGQGVSVESSDYPDEQIDIIAPEGRKILLNFDYVSLRPEAFFIITDSIEPVKTQNYNGGGEQDFPPFLSRRNRLRITQILVGSSGRGFNITASCYEISETNTGRLVDGNTPAEGYLELSTKSDSGGEWVRVCEENLSHRVAEVVCGELGYAIVKEVAYDNGGCQSRGSGGNCVRAPVCGEYAYRLQDCSPPSTNCTSSKAVKIKCFEPGFIGCYNHGINQLENSSIHSSTAECVSSCRSDTEQALAIVNDSQLGQCFCSTDNDIRPSDLTIERACTYPVYNASVGFCNKTDDVMNGSWDSNNTWFGSIVHLTCDEGYNLIGNGTLQCVPRESPFIPQWNDSMPTCEIDASSEDTTPFTIGACVSTFDHGHDVYPSPGTTSLHRLAVPRIIMAVISAALCLISLMKALTVYVRYRHSQNKHRGKKGKRCTAPSFVTSKKRSQKTEEAMKPLSWSHIRDKPSEVMMVTTQ